jgi:hypothetical protein
LDQEKSGNPDLFRAIPLVPAFTILPDHFSWAPQDSEIDLKWFARSFKSYLTLI